jgi:hypothetical protein
MLMFEQGRKKKKTVHCHRLSYANCSAIIITIIIIMFMEG